jgi:hypothetical protein
MILSQDFKELLQLLNDNHVEYLVVGGYATILYGYVRATGDIDLWVRATPENASALLKALKEFGFGDLQLSEVDFSHEGAIVQLGYPPYRVDILTSIDGVAFSDCFLRKHLVAYENFMIPFIDLEDLKTNKRATGRLKDLADVEQLEQ